MERNSAACVMEWSVELEKALRSTKPGRSLEAILEIGPKLVQLSREPECSPAIYHMFGLIPGEDKLFSNAIVMRLANAFKCGDKDTRVCVLKAFLYEYRRRNKGRESRGVLSRIEDCVRVECLERVKVVFDSGDVEDKALALGLFGCWAHFAKESPSIRYLVLSSLVSPHIMEVKASLFAAGCFAELSEDFARIVLEMLLHLMNSPETLPGIRLAGARMFAKLGFTNSIAINAYKTGVKLLSECLDEDYQVAMLVSVSKLASRSTILISEHVDLLILFLNKEQTFRLRGTALRCLHYIFSKGMYQVLSNASLMNTLLSMLDAPQLPSPMLFQALQTLRKVILCMHPNLPFDVFESSKLLSIARNIYPSPITSEKMLAISLLVDISKRLKGSTGVESCVHSESLLPSRVVSLIIDQITLMVRCQIDSVVLRIFNSLLNLLIVLSREYPDLHLLVLDHIFGLIKSISIVDDPVMATTDTGAFVHDKVDLKESSVIRSKLVYRIHRFLVTFLENLSEADALSTNVFEKVKIVVEHLCQSNLFDCYAHTIYSLLLHHQFISGHLAHESESSGNRLLGISVRNDSVEHESHVIEFAKRMLTEKSGWAAYRAGKYAACQGAWHTATFIFEQLVKRVRYDLCCRWLKSLVHYAHGEWKCELLRLPKQGLETHKSPLTVSVDDLGQISQDAARNIKGPICSKELAAAYNSLLSSLKTLRVDVTTDHFYFQRWFLSLRTKLLGAVVGIHDILRNIFKNSQGQKSSMVEYFIPLQKLTQISLQLKRVAQEYDLIKSSFIDIDKKSSSIISALAISCSLLAFCSGFALYIPSLANSVATCGPGVALNDAVLIQNLVGRLWHSKHETIRDLCLLWEAGGKPLDCFHTRSRVQSGEIFTEARDILEVSSYAVTRFCSLKIKYNTVQNGKGLAGVTKDGLQLLLETVMKWMQIPFRTPKYYFNLRPCLGSELFAVNETRIPDGICVSVGFHLSLNLCLQLRNVPPDIPVRFNKFYCMLYCKPSFLGSRASGIHKEHDVGTNQAWETDDMVENYDLLLKYATKCGTKKGNKRGRSSDDGELVNSFVCFDVNDRGQGFSSCLLDVSGFPVGNYSTKWYSCCIDKQGKCWTLPSLNPGPLFTVQSPNM